MPRAKPAKPGEMKKTFLPFSPRALPEASWNIPPCGAEEGLSGAPGSRRRPLARPLERRTRGRPRYAEIGTDTAQLSVRLTPLFGECDKRVAGRRTSAAWPARKRRDTKRHRFCPKRRRRSPVSIGSAGCPLWFLQTLIQPALQVVDTTFQLINRRGLSS